MKYKVSLNQEEIDALYIASKLIHGDYKYINFFEKLQIVLSPYTSNNIKKQVTIGDLKFENRD